MFPDWIGETTEGHKTLTVRGFEALTVEAVRDLRRENTELRRRLDSLEARLDACAAARRLTATRID